MTDTKISATSATTTLPQTASYPVALVGDTTARRITHATLRGGLFNVKDYGAVGDGVTNDTAAIQAAIDAAPVGSCVVFPPGIYSITSLSVTKSITLMGLATPWTLLTSPFGDALWASLLTTYHVGAILRSSVTSGAAITLSSPNYQRVVLEHLYILGPGSGTSVGIDSVLNTDASISAQNWQDVLVANFSIGVRLTGVQGSVFNQLRIRGCSKALQIYTNTNQNVFVGIDINTATANAIDISNAVENVFYGGAIQGCTGTVVALDGDANALNGIYFENIGATYAIDGPVGADQNVISNCHFGEAGDNIRLAGNGNIVISPHSARTLTDNGNTILLGDFSGWTITGTPAGSGLYLNTAAAIFNLFDHDLRLSSGKKLYLETTASNNYIARESATGDTVISSATAVSRILQALKVDGNVGFYGAAPIAKPTGVAVSAGGIHAALVSLGLIAA